MCRFHLRGRHIREELIVGFDDIPGLEWWKVDDFGNRIDDKWIHENAKKVITKQLNQEIKSTRKALKRNPEFKYSNENRIHNLRKKRKSLTDQEAEKLLREQWDYKKASYFDGENIAAYQYIPAYFGDTSIVPANIFAFYKRINIPGIKQTYINHGFLNNLKWGAIGTGTVTGMGIIDNSTNNNLNP